MATRVLRTIARVLAEISAYWLFVIMLLVGVDVTMRFFFSKPIPGSLEISEQTVVIITFMAFAYTSMMKRHIRTTAIVDLLPAGVKPVAEYIGILLMAILLSLLIWQTGKEAWEALSIREVRMGLVPVPIYPTKIAIPISLSIAWLYYVLKLLGLAEDQDIEDHGGEEL
jgi:TRAP-type C4-dicarboxylate transport system permease small subunit